MACGCFQVKYKRKVDIAFPRNAGDVGDPSKNWFAELYARSHDGLCITTTSKNAANGEIPCCSHYSRNSEISEQNDVWTNQWFWFLFFCRMVHAGVQGFDKLMQACHLNLNAFVESYLTVLERLLESNVPDYQVMGTTSVCLASRCLTVLQFVKFSKIEEVNPNYNRHYDFFVDKFSAMCYKNPSNSLK